MKQNTLGNRVTLEMPLYTTLRHPPAQSTVQHGLKLDRQLVTAPEHVVTGDSF